MSAAALFRIAPSILPADFVRLGDEVKDVIAAGADWIDFDVMDNHYLPVDNIRRVAGAGPDTFVAGSAIFGRPHDNAVIDAMRLQISAPLANAA